MGELAKVLAEKINAEHRACERAAGEAVEHAMNAGDYLGEAKRQAGHGNWLSWLAENFEGSQKTANTYMRLAANREALGSGDQKRASNLSIRGALAELSSAAAESSESEELARLDAEIERLGIFEYNEGGLPVVKDDTVYEDLVQAWKLSEEKARLLEGRKGVLAAAAGVSREEMEKRVLGADKTRPAGAPTLQELEAKVGSGLKEAEAAERDLDTLLEEARGKMPAEDFAYVSGYYRGRMQAAKDSALSEIFEE